MNKVNIESIRINKIYHEARLLSFKLINRQILVESNRINKIYHEARLLSFNFIDQQILIESNRINKSFIATLSIQFNIISPKKPIFDSDSDSDFIAEICLDEVENEITNMMVIDVETAKTGELIQIAYNIYNSDFECIKQFDCLINENNGKIDFYEKYTLMEIMENGRSPRDAFKEIKIDIKSCSHVIGHNIAFDIGKIDKYFKKLSMVYHRPINICTMQQSKKLCNLKNIKGGLKPPKLSELFLHCFNCDPDTTKTHTADYDIEITFMCFHHLYKTKAIKM
jgi:hypothetical protein